MKKKTNRQRKPFTPDPILMHVRVNDDVTVENKEQDDKLAALVARLTALEIAAKEKIEQLELDLEVKEAAFNLLKQSLVSFLQPEQLDAASVCGVSPEFYALEWLRSCRTGEIKFNNNYKELIKWL